MSPAPAESRTRKNSVHIAVIGSGHASPEQTEMATDVGSAIGAAGAILVCGGLGGVMKAACIGAKAAGGTTVGILPGSDRGSANDYVDIAIATGLGEARNAIVVGCSDAVIAVGGEFGTLSEIALALRGGKPVVGLKTWELRPPGHDPDKRGVDKRGVDQIVVASDPSQAVSLALQLARNSAEIADNPQNVIRP